MSRKDKGVMRHAAIAMALKQAFCGSTVRAEKEILRFRCAVDRSAPGRSSNYISILITERSTFNFLPQFLDNYAVMWPNHSKSNILMKRIWGALFRC